MKIYDGFFTMAVTTSPTLLGLLKDLRKLKKKEKQFQLTSEVFHFQIFWAGLLTR